ncbi:MAG: hypothetical protein IKQ00_04380 [Butyrivibrio sp.]|nr:hypothetical protein [Butyrivibrio sp.]
MKKRKTTAILIASTLMLSIVGCSGAPSASGSSEMEMTEAELREAAREAMIATEDSSAAASSGDTSASASSEASAAASSAEAASVDTVATASSAEATGANAISTASGTDKPFKLEEHNFVYNGVTSVMEDTSAIMSKLGKYDKKETPCTGMASYSYGSGDVYLITGVCGNQEIPIDVAIYRQGIRTIRNVGVGSSLSDVINAYSDCTRNSFSLGKDYGEIISLGSSCSIYFYFSSKTDCVIYYTFTNEDSLNKLYPVKADIKEKAKEIVEDKGKQAPASNSNDSAANATTAPAANNATPAPAPAANNTTPAANTTQNAGSLAEYEIMLNGKKVSILDDAATVQANLGKLEEKDTTRAGSAEEPRYVYSSNNIIFYTFVDNGNELTYDLCVYEKGAKTSRGVGVGDSKDAIVAAYGNPVETYEYYQGFGMKYKFDKFTLYFDFDSNTNKVTDVVFGNNDTITKRHAKHPDYIGD